MSKNVIEFCEKCNKETPHKIKHHWYTDNKKRYMLLQPIRCLTCGYHETKAQKIKTSKHISLK